MRISYIIGAVVLAVLVIGGLAWYDSMTQLSAESPTTATGQYSPAVSGAATGADQIQGSSVSAPASSVAPAQ